MVKKTLTVDEISSETEAWDAIVDTMFSRIRALIEDNPFPLAEYANIGSFPDATQNDRSVGFVNDATAGWILAIGDGTVWTKIGKQAATISGLTDNTAGSAGNTLAAIPNPANSPATADALRDDLVTNTLPPIRDAIASLAAKVNGIRANLIASGAMAP